MAKEPDVTVAIDLGTTFTGVGFLFPSGTTHIFNNWPGSNNNNESKVPSRLVYNKDNTVSSWGFSCALHDDPLPPGKREQRLFKMFLDPETGDKARYKGLTAICSTSEASDCTADFLREIHRHIKRTYEGLDGGEWFSAAVVFLFSVPTTWRGLEASNTLKAAIKSAGFGNGGPHHRVQIDLTEAEAAAVDILKSGVARFNEGDVFLTIDAGGGTTDLSLVQVTKVNGDIRQMSQIAEVSGIGVGSMLIDYGFGNLIEQRLARSPDVPFDISNGLAHRLMNSERFQTVKHLFGDPAAIASVHRILIPGVSNTFNHERLGIEEGQMIIDDNELRGLFNPHVKRIIDKIQMQLDWMIDNGRSEQVTRVVLSGGLGKSHYVQRRIAEHFAQLTHPNARNVRVIASKDPQTTVVRGLLEDQKQKLETGNKPVLATYIARASYGVVVRETYDPNRHIGEDVEEDSFNPKHLWAIQQIAWLVRKGDKIDPNVPIKRHFESRLQPGGRSISLSTEIVTSKNETGVLPQSKKKGGVQDLCRVDSTLNDLNEDDLEFKKKRRVWGFSKGYKYYNCPVDVQVIVAPADLRFELWFKDQRVSRDHDPINVIWS